MKNKITTILCMAMLSWTAQTSIAQDPYAILELSRKACQKVTGGYYEMTSHMKYMSKTDTTSGKLRSWFRKLPKDECFGFAFHTNQWYDGNYDRYRVYTGQALISGSDSSALVTSVDQWKERILDVKHNYDSYSPITEPGEVFPTEKKLKRKERTLSLLPEENVNGVPCYKIYIQHKVDNDPKEAMQRLGTHSIFWIDKTSYLVNQYVLSISLVMNKDTMDQYERVTLDSFRLFQPDDESMLQSGSIPAWYTMKDYTPYKETPLLANTTPAPLWSFPSLTNDSVHLEQFRGKVVLLDFFYKSCYPCMQALPALQALHDKYKDRGLVVIGINPYDTPEDDLAGFLQKRNVSYTVVYADRDFPKSYHVSGYPTFYIIGKDGNILHSQSGYGPHAERYIEKIIAENL